MRALTIVLLLFLSTTNVFCFSQNTIEVDLLTKKLSLADFNFGEYKISGEFTFELNQESSSLTLKLSGEDIIFQDREISKVELSLEQRQGIIFIKKFFLPKFTVEGNLDLNSSKIALNIDGKWYEESNFLKGLITSKAKVWGNINNFFVSGTLTLEDGEYKGNELSHFRLDFFGKPPLFNITDSEIVLKDGNVLRAEGVLDLHNFSNLMPGAKFTAEKVFIDNWQLSSEGRGQIGLRKSVDEKIDVFFGTGETDGQEQSAETEVRYNLKDDKYLKLRMEEDKTTFRFEKRRDF